jgi:hypothetical protein
MNRKGELHRSKFWKVFVKDSFYSLSNKIKRNSSHLSVWWIRYRIRSDPIRNPSKPIGIWQNSIVSCRIWSESGWRNCSRILSVGFDRISSDSVGLSDETRQKMRPSDPLVIPSSGFRSDIVGWSDPTRSNQARYRIHGSGLLVH